MGIFSLFSGSQATKELSKGPENPDAQSQALPNATRHHSSASLPPASAASSAASVGQAGLHSEPDASPSGSSLYSRRSLRQLGLFFAGAGFLTASILVSRRAAVRHHVAAQLKYYHPNYRSAKKGDQAEQRDPMVAFEALNLATLNVMGFAIMATGGAAWAFDVSSLEELKTRARRSLYGPGGSSDEESEREVAEWVAKALGNGASRADEGETGGNDKGSRSR